jgi:NAD(P)-dependent dehydrogenase (short-subunit alcohol dehydrogenase family)
VVVNDYGGGLRGEDGNNPGPADAVVAEIEAEGGTALAACCDIGSAQQVTEMMAAVLARFGRVDVVVHNASTYAELSAFDGSRVEDLERILKVNAVGGWNVTQAAWGAMQRQHYGRVVLTGSAAGYFGRPQDLAYSMAKAALMPMAKVLSAEGAPFGIKVNMMAPVAFTENAKAQGFPEFMGRYAPPILITHVVAALAHEDCPVNGEMLHCGGGYVGRAFVGETHGVVRTPETMSAESVIEDMGRILDMERFDVHATTEECGARLVRFLAAQHPDLAAALSRQ